MAMDCIFSKIYLCEKEMKFFQEESKKEGSKSAYLRRLISNDYKKKG